LKISRAIYLNVQAKCTSTVHRGHLSYCPGGGKERINSNITLPARFQRDQKAKKILPETEDIKNKKNARHSLAFPKGTINNMSLTRDFPNKTNKQVNEQS
jgi:hypothetical protein